METVPDEDEMGPMDLTLGEHKLEEDVAPSSRPEPQLTYYELRRRYLSHGHGDKTKDRTASAEILKQEEFLRVSITGQEHFFESPEVQEALAKFREAIHLRNLYIDDTFQALDVSSKSFSNVRSESPAGSPGKISFEMIDGVMRVYEVCGKKKTNICAVRSVSQYYSDLETIVSTMGFGPCKTVAWQRLQLLESRFQMHKILNSEIEMHQQKAVPHRDFYNVRKVDNHIHHSACMNQKHLLRFIKKKLKTEPETKVIQRDGRTLTLKEVFDSLDLSAYDLSIDALNMHAHGAFHRFDKFNLKYNPIGETRLREIFLKTDNMIDGRFLAEITKEVFTDLEANKYQFAELRLSIYGKKRDEWLLLSKWFCDFDLRCSNIKWMIQIPRLYSVYKKAKMISNFQEMIDSILVLRFLLKHADIFLPLFEASVEPSLHPEIDAFLKEIVAFDTVDDESIREPQIFSSMLVPQSWDMEQNPPYSMWSYYIYANLKVLHALRRSRGLSTFEFRPHAGEAGDLEHLASAFLLAKSIAHGLLLKKAPALQYLYFLTQIGISMSPLSNNLLFVNYSKNPFPEFFARGLNVTLSTDDPLMIHYTKEPLVEEYSVAAQVWKLNSTDLCEIARRSVLISAFEETWKAHCIGDEYLTKGITANDIHRTNVPPIRISFRHELRDLELDFVFCKSRLGSKHSSPRGETISN